MLSIKELVILRKMLGIRGVDIANNMSTTRQNVNYIETSNKSSNMTKKFYRLIVTEMINEINLEKKGELKDELKNIITFL